MSAELVQKNWFQVYRAIKECMDVSPLGIRCRLVAVSKTKPAELIEALYQMGQRHFGENYVQELEEKSAILKEKLPEIKWNFIGQVQSNKISRICNVPNIYCIHTIESEKHASLFEKEWAKLGLKRKLHIYVQVNTSEEPNKGGILPAEAPNLAEFIRENCEHLAFDGFMTIGSFANSHCEGPNPDFEALSQVRKRWAEKTGKIETSVELSMGMSDDFLQAIRQGGTVVRVGSKIFGEREYKRELL